MKRFAAIIIGVFICGVAFAQTISIDWKVNNNTYAQNTCEYGGTLTVPPTPPTKYGYTFMGWGLYQQLEYIESTGTQYINTNLSPTTGTFRIVANIYVENSAVWKKILGYATDSAGSPLGIWVRGGTIKETFRNVNGNTIGEVDKWQNIDVVNQNTVTINNFYIFEINPAIQSFSIASAKIKSVKLYKDNVLILDMIPVQDGLGVVGMFDIVSETFFGNAGTGEFIAGPVAR